MKILHLYFIYFRKKKAFQNDLYVIEKVVFFFCKSFNLFELKESIFIKIDFVNQLYHKIQYYSKIYLNENLKFASKI